MTHHACWSASRTASGAAFQDAPHDDSWLRRQIILSKIAFSLYDAPSAQVVDGVFRALSHAINRQDLPRLHNPLILYGLKQGKRVKNPRKTALFFLDTFILLSPMSKKQII